MTEICNRSHFSQTMRPHPPILPALRALLILGLVLSCSEVEQKAPRLQEGRWRAALQIGDRDLPFYMEVQSEGGEPRAWILDGAQRIPMIFTSIDPIVMELEHFDSRFEVSASADATRLEGRWRLTLGDRKVEFPFEASAGDSPLFSTAGAAGESVSQAPLADRWDIQFAGESSHGVALFESNQESVAGNFLHFDGDFPTVRGNFDAGHLQLSHFGGGRAYVIDAALQEDGTLAGHLIDPIFVRDVAWTGRPDPEARLPEALDHARVVEEFDLESLVVYDLEAVAHDFSEIHTPGRVLLVEILGTWCPTCHEAAAFLMEMYRSYGPHDLQVIALAFEMSDDFEKNVERIERYRKRHEIEYPIYLASKDGMHSPTERIPLTQGSYAFPTVLFVDTRGDVRHTYAGFRSATQSLEHEAMKTQWRSTIEHLLDEASRHKG